MSQDRTLGTESMLSLSTSCMDLGILTLKTTSANNAERPSCNAVNSALRLTVAFYGMHAKGY